MEEHTGQFFLSQIISGKSRFGAGKSEHFNSLTPLVNKERSALGRQGAGPDYSTVTFFGCFHGVYHGHRYLMACYTDFPSKESLVSSFQN